MQCMATRRVMATIEEGPTAREILRHLRLPAEPPRRAPARLDQGELFATGPPANDACEPPPEDDLDQRWPSPLDTA